MYELILLAFIPLLGVMVRYRATYHPKPGFAAAKATSSSPLSPPTPTLTITAPRGEESDVKQPTDIPKDDLVDEKDGQVEVELETNPDAVPESAPAPTFTGVWRNVWREEVGIQS